MKRAEIIHSMRESFDEKRARLELELNKLDLEEEKAILKLEEELPLDEDDNKAFTEEIPGYSCSLRHCGRADYGYERLGPIEKVRAYRLDTNLRVCDFCFDSMDSDHMIKDLEEQRKRMKKN